ncbi:MAG: hypothetical protein ACJ73L_11555, partial [Actinomycetes bacterium]
MIQLVDRAVDVEVERFGLDLRVLVFVVLLVLVALLVLFVLVAPVLRALLLRLVVDVDDFGALADFFAALPAFFAGRLVGRRAACGTLVAP